MGSRRYEPKGRVTVLRRYEKTDNSVRRSSTRETYEADIEVWECQSDGCLVTDTALHDRWHDSEDELMAAALNKEIAKAVTAMATGARNARR